MNKFIKSLKDYLEEKNIKKEHIEETISDYNEFYEEYKASGLTDDEIVARLGSPKEIYRSLKTTLSKNKELTYKSKIISITPFISVIIYVLIGYFTKVWHPTWLVFLLIPITSVLLNSNSFIDSLLKSSPFISTTIFLLVGLYTSYWHPTWLIFLLIPFLGTIQSGNSLLDKISNSIIFLGLATAVLLPYYNILDWKYSWLFIIIFVIPQMLKTVIRKENNFKTIISLISFVVAVISYLILVYLGNKVALALLVFLLPFFTSIWSKQIEVNFNIASGIKRIIIISSIVLSTTLFVVLGITFNSFAYIWQILLIPIIISVYLVPKDNSHRLTSVAPFLAIIIFYSLGYFYNLWSVSWLAFLLIPIVSILESKPTFKYEKNNN